ncbi:hypothetical protein RD055328_03670 [Companilactobacillus sp. RD055328]|uniref:LVIS_2131 family protein n=1 Tax=Companilactobacillus sp. RD055328 TaxID=2916634 RepID=UPI001FC8D1DA|nr:LVIS_2131 family protein [Companilactobacillus sp. RD055328]GKQ42444.1 hypothetical protein RD055328_03670 [Companilactobacillus sp. RD055328]
MGSSWNFVGIIAWIILIGWFIFIIHDIRRRHLKMIVVDKKRFSFLGTIVDILEIIVLVAGFFFMSSVTFFNHVNVNDDKQVSISYEYEPLVIQTSGSIGHYVEKENNGKTSTDKYTYWVANAKYTITSRNASVIDDSSRLDDSAIANYPWNKKELLKNDKNYQEAFVVTLNAKYKNNFMNGLGLHAGRHATDYTLIKIPSANFMIDK